MRSVLIIGASRGIGLGLVDRHLANGWRVHATTRDGTPPRDGVETYPLDVRDPEQLEAMITGLGSSLDRVIHNAGIKHGTRSDIMEINAEAPIMVIQTLIDRERLEPDATIAIMSSQVGARRGRTGSLGDYGDSKAALNDEFRRRSDQWGRACVVAVVMHPGWVRTDMGGTGAPLSVAESADGITAVLDSLTAADHGKFLTWDGREHPW